MVTTIDSSRDEEPVEAESPVDAAFAGLRERAHAHWRDLNSGDTPWVKVGFGASGQAAGAQAVYDALSQFGEDGSGAVRLSKVGTRGLMYLEPTVEVVVPGGNRILHANVEPAMVEDLITPYLGDREVRALHPSAMARLGDLVEGAAGSGLESWDGLPAVALQTKVLTENFGVIDPHDVLQYVARGGYSALHKALSAMTTDEVLEEVKSSGLRGRGGAAFPTGLKWSFLAPSDAPVKYVLCNCEEGDPGAFNDKGILESDPHLLLEGLILNGYATRSTHGVVFIRQGHDFPIDATRTAINQAYESGLLGANILGSDFSFEAEVSLTGDSYVAGEETAMMEAIEGKRSTPRYKPPFPAAVGLWQKPTNINNVKTLSYVPRIVKDGSEEFREIGTSSSSGTALICLTGKIERPGLYEVAMGMTINQVLEDIGGGVAGGNGSSNGAAGGEASATAAGDNGAPKAEVEVGAHNGSAASSDGKLDDGVGNSIRVLQTGGPLGGVMGREAFDIEIDFDAMSKAGAILGSGGIIVGDDSTDVVDLIRNMVAFNQFESCGKCFPCRLGYTHMLDVLNRMCQNEARAGDMELLEKVGLNMKVGSLCGHGQLGYNPISSALTYFRKDFEDRLSGKLPPSGSSEGHPSDGTMLSPTRTRPAGQSD